MKDAVCHISTVHNSFDDRIYYRELKSLSEAGYETHLVAVHPGNETVNNINIHALPPFRGFWSRWIRGSLLAFRLALRTQARVCHFHDPELMFCGLLLRIMGRKVIYDVHEDLPRQVLTKTWIRPAGLRVLLSWIIGLAEGIASWFFSGVVVVTNDIARRFPRRKTCLVRNFPVLSLIPQNVAEREEDRDRFVLIYTGGITAIRGVLELIRAVGQMEGECVLWLLGEFEDPAFLEQCRNAQGWEYVRHFGKVRHDLVFPYIIRADAGVALLHPVKNYLTSLPVKAFEYLACGKPMIMSDFPYWKEFFAGCALFTDPREPSGIGICIRQLMASPETAKALGSEGLDRIHTGWSWEKEREKLFLLYNRLLDDNRQGA
ncbi:MAG: glycosyltransferase [Bacteroidales bacterium]|nr:glycosyltransferase [Bacteroidales bacterium]